MPSMALKVFCILISSLFLLSGTPAFSMNNLESYIPAVKKVGEGRLTYFWWDVYDAEFFASQGDWNYNPPFALKLSYLRDLTGQKIADRSIEEIRRQGFSDEVKLATWHTQMLKIFPDIQVGDVLTGIYTDAGEAVFYMGDVQVGRIKDEEFSRVFFNIWLDEKTSEPDLRRKLLGAI